MTRQASVWEQAVFRRWPGCLVLGEGRFVMVCIQDHRVAVAKLFEWPAARQAELKSKTPCNLLCEMVHRAEELELPEQPKQPIEDWERERK